MGAANGEVFRQACLCGLFICFKGDFIRFPSEIFGDQKTWISLESAVVIPISPSA